MRKAPVGQLRTIRETRFWRKLNRRGEKVLCICIEVYRRHFAECSLNSLSAVERFSDFLDFDVEAIGENVLSRDVIND